MEARFPRTSIALLAATALLAACSGADEAKTTGGPPPCVENLNTNCNVQHDPPIYSTIYREIIQPQCALSSCHSTDGAMGGLVLANVDDSYDALLGLKGGTKRVVPRDPACSPLMVRLESHDPEFVMPRGKRLLEPELCDFVQWIKQGAEKN